MSFGLGDETSGVTGHDVGQLVARTRIVVGELLAQVVARETDGPSRVLFLYQAKQVGRVADLGLHLFFAVAKVVVRDDGDDHAALVAGAHLEGTAAVVELLGVFPAHAVATVPSRCVVEVRQPQLPFGEFRQVRGQDHCAGVPSPAPGPQGCVVLGQVGIATIAEDTFHEIEVRHQGPGGEEPHLQAAFPGESGDVGDHHGTQQQRHPGAGGLLVGRTVGEDHRIRGRIQSVFKQAAIDSPRNSQLVVLDSDTTLSDVKHPFGGAPVIAGVVQHAVHQPIATQVLRRELILSHRQRHRPGQARLIQYEGLPGKPRRGVCALQV